ncbi:hypothetical protein KKH43_02200 [Patescibacteria group bacterium]|nr:hypothetical protein [Patescibacteria group bacterium]
MRLKQLLLIFITTFFSCDAIASKNDVCIPNFVATGACLKLVKVVKNALKQQEIFHKFRTSVPVFSSNPRLFLKKVRSFYTLSKGPGNCRSIILVVCKNLSGGKIAFKIKVFRTRSRRIHPKRSRTALRSIGGRNVSFVRQTGKIISMIKKGVHRGVFKKKCTFRKVCPRGWGCYRGSCTYVRRTRYKKCTSHANCGKSMRYICKSGRCRRNKCVAQSDCGAFDQFMCFKKKCKVNKCATESDCPAKHYCGAPDGHAVRCRQKKQLGEKADSPRECLSGYKVEGKCSKFQLVMQKTRPQPRPIVGKSCTKPSDCGDGYLCPAGKCVVNTCADDSDCTPDMYCDVLKSKCKDRLPKESTCDRLRMCIHNLRCISGKCMEKITIIRKKKKFGESCATTYDCEGGLTCEDRGQERKCVGGSSSYCRTHDQCSANLYCDLNGQPSKCAFKMGKGARECTKDYMCQKGLECKKGTCLKSGTPDPNPKPEFKLHGSIGFQSTFVTDITRFDRRYTWLIGGLKLNAFINSFPLGVYGLYGAGTSFVSYSNTYHQGIGVGLVLNILHPTIGILKPLPWLYFKVTLGWFGWWKKLRVLNGKLKNSYETHMVDLGIEVGFFLTKSLTLFLGVSDGVLAWYKYTSADSTDFNQKYGIPFKLKVGVEYWF